MVNIYNRKQSANQGFINNQITDWSFKVDEVLHNVSQETVYNKVVKDITLKALEGYNGTLELYHCQVIFYNFLSKERYCATDKPAQERRSP